MSDTTETVPIYNYCTLNDLYNEELFEYKQFDEFEYRLFNNITDGTKIDLDHLFIQKNENALVSLANYYYLIPLKYGSAHLKCINYLVQLGNSEGYLKLGNYTYDILKKNDAAIQLYKHAGDKGLAIGYYNAAVIYCNDKNYTEANKMVDKAIALKTTNYYYYILKAHSNMSLRNFPKALYAFYLSFKTFYSTVSLQIRPPSNIRVSPLPQTFDNRLSPLPESDELTLNTSTSSVFSTNNVISAVN